MSQISSPTKNLKKMKYLFDDFKFMITWILFVVNISIMFAGFNYQALILKSNQIEYAVLVNYYYTNQDGIVLSDVTYPIPFKFNDYTLAYKAAQGFINVEKQKNIADSITYMILIDNGNNK